MSTTIKLRRGTYSQWNIGNNIVLASGEPAFELDTGRLKIGNGLTAWSGLPYSFILPTGFRAGTNIGLSYNNSDNTLTISTTGNIGNGVSSQGVQGIQGTQGIGFNWTGEYSYPQVREAPYNVNDIVFYNGSTYVCIQFCPEPIRPDTDPPLGQDYWRLFTSQGVQGNQGIQGLRGDAGTIGNPGIQGSNGIQGLGFNFLGNWSERFYDKNDVVVFEGSSWVCLETFANDIFLNPTQNPSRWAILSQRGSQGIQGIQGVSIQGIQGSIGIQGIIGIQGSIGPTAGTFDQIVYKNSSNFPAGSDNLLFDGSKLISNSGLFTSNLSMVDSRYDTIPSDSTLYIRKNNIPNTGSLVHVQNSDNTLFNISNNLSESILSVNNNAGVPVFEVLSNSVTRIGRYNQNDFIVNNSGNIGIGTNNPLLKLQVNGSFGATTKSFRINHPSKNNHILEYGSLESPYHGVRLTGRGIINNGYCKIYLPEYIKDLIIDNESINIQLTNFDHNKLIYVSKINLNKHNFEVKTNRCKNIKNLKFFWTFTGTRKDIPILVTEQEGNV